MRQFLTILFLMVMIPYVTTLAWTGKVEVGDLANESGVGASSGIGAMAWADNMADSNEESDAEPLVIVVRNEREFPISVEEFLVHVLAAQVPVEFEPETLKAQAVLARTYIYGLMDGKRTIHEEELDMDARSEGQMEKLWGEKAYSENLSKLQEAVNKTSGIYIIYEGTIIEPLFCYVSAGKTRSRGDAYPYLKQAESSWDLQAENYRSLPVFELREFVRRINEIPEAVPVAETDFADGGGIQIVERDGSGYVKQVQIGQKTFSGEEVQYALELASPCYSFEQLEGKIRVICKGIGHGYGFSQFGANEMAKEGKGYEELLKYYFQNVEIVRREL